MVVYYHTNAYIYAVTNGYCSSVMLPDGDDYQTGLVGERLLGGVTDCLGQTIVSADHIQVGMRLKFELRCAALITDVIERIETVSSLSIPPVSRISRLPETVALRDPIPTLPEILGKDWGID